jgi:biopolymer transport protein ExbD
MARRRRPRRDNTKAAPNLTPMIDVTFQLLIFFILCTRFKVEERDHQVQLPKDEGLDQTISIPKEQITIYCVWDDDAKINSYVLAHDARDRRAVDNSAARLTDLVIFPSDNTRTVRQKKDLYKQIFDNLVSSLEERAARMEAAGVKLEKIEISFARDATQGARSGTAPWMFVSLALDAATMVNKNRKATGKTEFSITFKFADARGRFAQ